MDKDQTAILVRARDKEQIRADITQEVDQLRYRQRYDTPECAAADAAQTHERINQMLDDLEAPVRV